jgi:hypothetical protein
MNSLKVQKNYAGNKKKQWTKAKKAMKKSGSIAMYQQDEKGVNKASDKLLNIYSNLVGQEAVWHHKQSDKSDKRSSKNTSRMSNKRNDPNLQHFLINMTTSRKETGIRRKVFNSKSARSEIVFNNTCLTKKYIDIDTEFEDQNSKNIINDASVFHHCSQLSNKEYGRIKKPFRLSMMSKNSNSPTSPCLASKSIAQQKHIHNMPKENMIPSSLYSKVKDRMTDIGFDVGKLSVFNDTGKKMNSRDLPPMCTNNSDIGNGNSRNNRYAYLINKFRKIDITK